MNINGFLRGKFPSNLENCKELLKSEKQRGFSPLSVVRAISKMIRTVSAKAGRFVHRILHQLSLHDLAFERDAQKQTNKQTKKLLFILKTYGSLY